MSARIDWQQTTDTSHILDNKWTLNVLNAFLLNQMKPIMKPYYGSLNFTCILRQLSLRTFTVITNRYVTV